MHRVCRVNDSVHFYISELSARVVAKSGRPTDRYHLGKLILQGLKDAPDFVAQIDAATGAQETCKSVLERSVVCAKALRSMGLSVGDIMILMAPNHNDLAIAYYAALYLGISIAPIDQTLTIGELQDVFEIDKPKIIFCQSERVSDIRSATNNVGIDPYVVTFDEKILGLDRTMHFREMMEKYYGENSSVEEFKAEDFDADETTAVLISTSGTTGLPKQTVTTHKNLSIIGTYMWTTFTQFPTPTKTVLLLSPLQWISAIIHFNMSPILRITRLQSSGALTVDHIYDMINKYKPTFTFITPTLVTALLKPGQREKCDLTCLERLYLVGSAVPKELKSELKTVMPNTLTYVAYAMSEGVHFGYLPEPFESCGVMSGSMQYRIVDIETEEDIVKPNVTGELWGKGPGVFKKYYNNPEATKAAFKDGWFRTGDMFYRDEHWNFYFVDRIKLLLKYKNNQVSPTEVENVIRKHPSVLDVAVTGIPDREAGELVVACVVKRPGHQVTAGEIKELVKSSLADSKQLRGGVIFIESLPLTKTGKIDRRGLKQIVLTLPRE